MTTVRTPQQRLDLRGRVIVVTGAAAGIGAGIARRLSAAGASVVVHTRRTSVDAVMASLPGPSASVTADLVDEDAPRRVVAGAIEAFGRIDGLVNNAAVQTLAPLAETSDDAWREMIETNLTAVHRLSRAIAARLVEQGGGGSIVHIASIEGMQPAPMHGHYAASKAGVIMHARAMALEFGEHGIRVNCVSPGLIDREGLAEQWPEGVQRWQQAAPLRRLGTAEDVGDACVFLMSELARWVTGANLVVDGGVTARPSW